MMNCSTPEKIQYFWVPLKGLRFVIVEERKKGCEAKPREENGSTRNPTWF